MGVRFVGTAIRFAYPFAGYNSLTFTNCYASVYMHLEKIVGVDQYVCPRNQGKPCNGCGNCARSTGKLQEDHYFIMDTMSGRSAARPDFAGTAPETDNAPETIDFLMGLTGYSHERVQHDLPNAIRASIDCDRPVLARVKDESNGAFRVLTGYDGDTLIMADPKGAQRNPTTPTCDDIAEAIIITGKARPRYIFLDALRRIQSIMVQNRDGGIWESYIEQFRYWDAKLQDASFEEIQRRFKRICDIAWHNFNCHNFAETFRHRVWEPLKDPRLDSVCRQISSSYDNAHTRNWQLISLHDCRDWSKRRYNELEWGYCTCAVDCLEKLKQYDAEVLTAIEQAIATVADSSAEPAKA